MSTSELSEGNDGGGLRKGFEANHSCRKSDMWRINGGKCEGRIERMYETKRKVKTRLASLRGGVWHEDQTQGEEMERTEEKV